MLHQAIDELLDDNKEVVSEREAFLLNELQAMLEAQGLLADRSDVVIVAARKASGLTMSISVNQTDRSVASLASAFIR